MLGILQKVDEVKRPWLKRLSLQRSLGPTDETRPECAAGCYGDQHPGSDLRDARNKANSGSSLSVIVGNAGSTARSA